VRVGNLNVVLIPLLLRVQEKYPETITPEVQVEEEYSAGLSFKQGATSQARIKEIPPDVIEANTRWRGRKRELEDQHPIWLCWKGMRTGKRWCWCWFGSRRCYEDGVCPHHWRGVRRGKERKPEGFLRTSTQRSPCRPRSSTSQGEEGLESNAETADERLLAEPDRSWKVIAVQRPAINPGRTLSNYVAKQVYAHAR
jgi:hypothetical protein